MPPKFIPMWEDVFESTLWELPPAHFKVWAFLLGKKDDDGNVWMTPKALASWTKLKPSLVKKILTAFLSEDPHSRSQEEGGRRLIELSRGWHVVNHRKYSSRLRSRPSTTVSSSPKTETTRTHVGGDGSVSIPKTESCMDQSPENHSVVPLRENKKEGDRSESGSAVVCSRQGKTEIQDQNTPAAPADAAAEEESGVRKLFNEWYRRGPTKENGQPFKENFDEFEKALRKSSATLPEFAAKVRLRLDCFDVDDRQDRSFRLGMIRTFLQGGKWRDQEGPPQTVPPLAAPEPEVVITYCPPIDL